jgi:VWFA-related protein
MRCFPALFCVSFLLVGAFPQKTTAQNKPVPSAQPVIHVTSRLVFLDVTVLNKSGQPVVDGLTKDDFTITEDKRPQTIFSFEAPRSHAANAIAANNHPDAELPVTIFVLDMLNSSFEDFAFIRYAMGKYLAAQQPLLKAPAAMMMIGNQSLELLQGPTRNTADLLYALDHLPPAVPYKWAADSFIEERFNQSIDALQQIALENEGVPGRKIIIWVGHGGPSFSTRGLTHPVVHALEQDLHSTTNMLVDARLSLFVIYPGLKVGHFVYQPGLPPLPISAADAQTDTDSDHPFGGRINFGVFVNETGGKLFYNRNDVDAEIAQSQQLGSQYYTLTYRPREGNANGKFRRIRVTLRDPNLHAVTKTGYYAPDKSVPIDPAQQMHINLAQAARSMIPFAALDVKASGLIRHPESNTADITLLLQSKGIDWQPAENGKSTANVTLAAASLTGGRDILASNFERLILTAPTEDPAHLENLVTPLHIRIGVPRKTESIRVVMETGNGGRIGTVDLDRKAIDTAPAMSTPDPPLLCRQPCQSKPGIPVSQ